MQTKPTSLLVNIAGSKFEVLKLKNKNPPVIFLNGYRMNLTNWEKVYPQVAEKHHILLYNRLGIGKSSKATQEQDAETVVKNMRALFQQLNMQPPYLFVAHSMGGLFADLYAKTYPDDVAACVFVECPHPEEVLEQRKFKLPILLKMLNFTLKVIDRFFDRHVHSEDENIEKTIAQLQDAGNFPNIPIAVVSGQKKMPFMPQVIFKLHQTYQYKLAELSSNSKHYTCNKSGHFPQLSEPEKVISAILETSTRISNN